MQVPLSLSTMSVDCTVERPLRRAWDCHCGTIYTSLYLSLSGQWTICLSVSPHQVIVKYVCLSLPIRSVDYTSVCLSPSCQWTICLSVSPHHVSGLYVCLSLHIMSVCLSPSCQWTICLSVSPHHVSGLYVCLSLPIMSVDSPESMRLPPPLCTPFHLSPPCQWTIRLDVLTREQTATARPSISRHCQWTLRFNVLSKVRTATATIRPSLSPHHVSGLYVYLSLPTVSVDYTSISSSLPCQWTIRPSLSPHHVSRLYGSTSSPESRCHCHYT